MHRWLSLLILAGLLTLGGCSSSKSTAEQPPATPEGGEQAKAADAKKHRTNQQAYVFVDGEYVASTPAIVRVKRGFGAAAISLRVGKEERRRFEIEKARTSNRTTLDYSFGTDNFGGVQGYDLTDLNQNKAGTYFIPYYSHPIEVEDREYGLVLVVEN
jgi:hypothetical protein